MELRCRVAQDKYTEKLAEAFDFDFNGEIITAIKDLPKLPKGFSIGLIVGASGGGKTTLLKTLGAIESPRWSVGKSVASHFDSPNEAVEKFGAVGLNSIPQMCLPYHALSTGEQFRCDLARKLKPMALIDEFTSVVNRDVAKAASNAFRRYVDSKGLKGIVLASCHFDIIEWLRPDWVFRVPSGEFHSERCLSRPKIDISIFRTDRRLWNAFKKFHYLSANLNPTAHCYAGFWGGQLVAFGAVLALPSGSLHNAWRGHRTVVLPDFQGLGIGNRFSNALAGIYVDKGGRYFSRTAHPRMGNYREGSPLWKPTSKNRKLRTDINHINIYNKTFCDNKRVCWSHEFLGQWNDPQTRLKFTE